MTSKFLEEPFEGVIREGADTFLIHPASGVSLSFEEAYSCADTISESLPRGVLLLSVKDRLVFALSYLAALRSNTPVLVVDHETPIDTLRSLAKVFDVSSAVIDGQDGFYSWARTSLENNVPLFVNPEVSATVINKELAALMPTSGSTGSPKCVRVSYNNIRASALAIGQYLKISKLHPHVEKNLGILESKRRAGSERASKQPSRSDKQRTQADSPRGSESSERVRSARPLLH